MDKYLIDLKDTFTCATIWNHVTQRTENSILYVFCCQHINSDASFCCLQPLSHIKANTESKPLSDNCNRLLRVVVL